MLLELPTEKSPRKGRKSAMVNNPNPDDGDFKEGGERDELDHVFSKERIESYKTKLDVSKCMITNNKQLLQ